MSAAFAAPVAATNLLFLPTAHAPPLSLHQTAAATAAAAGFVFSNSFPAMADGPYTLPDLPYPYEALEPYIDAATMKVCANQNMRTWCTSSSAIVLRNYNGVRVVRIMTRGIQPYLPASLPPSCPPGRLLRNVFFRLAVVRYRRTIVPSHPAPTTLLFSFGLMSPSLHRFRRCYFYLWPRDSTSTTRCTAVSRTSTLDSARSNVWTGEWNGSGVPLFASPTSFVHVTCGMIWGIVWPACSSTTTSTTPRTWPTPTRCGIAVVANGDLFAVRFFEVACCLLQLVCSGCCVSRSRQSLEYI